MTKYQQFARKVYKPFGKRDEMWHPEILAECDIIDQEETARLEAEKAKVKEVLANTADISAALAGHIVFKVRFEGSHPKKKALTAFERKIVMALPPDVKAKVKGEKPLFESEAYDDLMNWIAKRRAEFAMFGIPHTGFDAAFVTKVSNIPAIEELAKDTEKQLASKVEEFLKDWPRAIQEAKEALGPLFNPADYASAETIRGAFKFSHVWMAFGVPEELKQFDPQIYLAAQEKAKKLWAEIEANGVALLRQTISDLVGNLVDALTPKEDGTKKKFHASNVEKIHEFIETFQNRNICKDAELEAEVQKLRSLVDGIDPELLSAGPKGDEALREKVRAQMEKAKASLDKLAVEASSRIIELD